ncbi:DUF805 domain-containing protein [Chitinophaga pinensis]|uniref:DUF805 domain-containing protein n=1 Tax=Chitinophaga pinensis (strain ATCC 43595 / DSM 2588 / LMG 13176 / NBRC 15968 / NCIMB 11800 / UQM 2034) TaxID=485918 RepID=A0A979G7I9_CHIPD|nr:DUF805 domain-containing protein [Chitinophaga pinensis]ACU62072.1 protein of unknown function DUF805 [Chitinophaga pinensis DSM 2588]
MFVDPFSFNWRITRLEYFMSFVIYLLALGLIGTLANLYFQWLLILFIPVIWFLLAQGAKRCHDLDRNMLWQLIPFYILWMIFASGTSGANKYGVSPEDSE